MKKLILFTFLVICFQLSFSQTYKKQRETKRSIFSGKLNINKLTQAKLYKAGKQTLVSQVDEILDTITKTIVNSQKIEFKYNANGRKTSEIYSKWNKASSSWKDSLKNEYTWDANNNVTSAVTFVWNKTASNWVNFYKDDFTYNASNNELTDLYYEWDDVNSKWLAKSKIEDAYDANQNLLTDTYSEWDGSKYAVFDQLAYTYDTKGNKLTDSYSTWNTITKKYDPVDQYKNSYTMNNNNDTSTYLTYNALTKKWVNISREIYSYDTKGNVLTYNYTEWNTTTIKWEDVTKTDNIYDSKNNRISSTNQNYNIKRGKWANLNQAQYTYDTTISNSQLILPYEEKIDNIFFKTKQFKALEYKWNTATSKWDSLAITTYNYKLEGVNIIQIHSNFEVYVYPNPANDKVTISIPNYSGNFEVKVFDITGKVLKVNEIGNNGFIDVSQLPVGIYSIKLYNAQTLLGVRKLIIN